MRRVAGKPTCIKRWGHASAAPRAHPATVGSRRGQDEKPCSIRKKSLLREALSAAFYGTGINGFHISIIFSGIAARPPLWAQGPLVAGLPSSYRLSEALLGTRLIFN